MLLSWMCFWGWGVNIICFYGRVGFFCVCVWVKYLLDWPLYWVQLCLDPGWCLFAGIAQLGEHQILIWRSRVQSTLTALISGIKAILSPCFEPMVGQKVSPGTIFCLDVVNFMIFLIKKMALLSLSYMFCFKTYLLPILY